jgi:hypothetical protein
LAVSNFEQKIKFSLISNNFISSQGSTVLGDPNQPLKLGETFIPYQVFADYVFGLGETTFG